MRALLLLANAQWMRGPGSYYQEDPYLPFVNYESAEIELARFDEYFGGSATLVKDETVQRQLSELMVLVFEGYRRAFPQFMANKVMPRALIYNEGGLFDAAAFADKRQEFHQGILFVSQAFVSSSEPMDIKLGILAHEFAHLYFRDSDREDRVFDIHYESPPTITAKETLAFGDWMDLSQVLGVLLLPESGAITRDADLMEYSGPAFNEILSSKNPNCGPALIEKISQKMDSLMTLYVPFQWDFVVETAEKKKFLANTTSEMERFVNLCTASEHFYPIPIPRRVVKVLREKGIGTLLPLESGLSLTQIFQLVREIKRALGQIEGQIRLREIRYSSCEDRADRMAVSVLKSMGRNPTLFAQAFLAVLGSDKVRCEEAIEKGEPIPFGNPTDIHHSVCYRLDRLQKFLKSGAQMPLLR